MEENCDTTVHSCLFPSPIVFLQVVKYLTPLFLIKPLNTGIIWNMMITLIHCVQVLCPKHIFSASFNKDITMPVTSNCLFRAGPDI